MPPKITELTREQKRAVKEAATELDRAYAAALGTLRASGVVPDETTACKLAPRGHCRGFKPPVRGSRCARPGCGHLFSQHHLPM